MPDDEYPNTKHNSKLLADAVIQTWDADNLLQYALRALSDAYQKDQDLFTEDLAWHEDDDWLIRELMTHHEVKLLEEE